MNPYHRFCRHCDTPRPLPDNIADHSAILGYSPRATAVAAVAESRALYSSQVQPLGEGRPTAEVLGL